MFEENQVTLENQTFEAELNANEWKNKQQSKLLYDCPSRMYAWSLTDHKKPTNFRRLRFNLIQSCNRLRRETGQRLGKLLNWLNQEKASETVTFSDPNNSDVELQLLIDQLRNQPLLPNLNHSKHKSQSDEIESTVDYTQKLLQRPTTVAEYAAQFEYTEMARQPPFQTAYSETNTDKLEQKSVWPNPAEEVQRLRQQLVKLDTLIEEMQRSDQEQTVKEDLIICQQNDRRHQLKMKAKAALNELNAKQQKVTYELNQCVEQLRRLKEEICMLKQRDKILRGASYRLRSKYHQATVLLHESLRNKQEEINETQRRWTLRRQQDVVLIRSYRLQQQKLQKQLALIDSSSLNANIESKTVEQQSKVNQKQFEEGLEALRNNEINSISKVSNEKFTQQATLSDLTSLQSTSLQTPTSSSIESNETPAYHEDIKLRCLQQLHHENRLCVRDVMLKMKANQGAKFLSRLTLLSNVEGIQLIDNQNKELTENELDRLQKLLLNLTVFSNSDLKQFESKCLAFGDQKMAKGTYQMLFKAKGTLVTNCKTAMQVRLMRFEENSSFGDKFQQQTAHIIRHLLIKSHCNIAKQVELFQVDTEKVSNTIRLFAHIEEQPSQTLEEFVQTDRLTIEELQTIAESIASALMYLHDFGVAHSALCTQSVFITSENVVKVGRLEYARMFYCGRSRRARLQRPSSLMPETCEWDYAAPEVHASLLNDKTKKAEIDLAKADVYSFGLLMFFCAFNQKPSSDLNQLQEIIRHKSFPVANQAFQSLVQQCLQPKSKDRITIFTALCDPFFSSSFTSSSSVYSFSSFT